MNRMKALTAQRCSVRHKLASAVVADILDAAAVHGIRITVIGSLARDDFRAHSDIDLLVRGPLDRARRILVERIVADAMRSSAIPCDLIFEDDLTEERLREFLHDLV